MQKSAKHAQLPLKQMGVGIYVRRSQWEVTLLSISGSGRDTGQAAMHACQQGTCVKLNKGMLQKQTCFQKNHNENLHYHTTMPNVVICIYALTFTKALR